MVCLFFSFFLFLNKYIRCADFNTLSVGFSKCAIVFELQAVEVSRRNNTNTSTSVEYLRRSALHQDQYCVYSPRGANTVRCQRHKPTVLLKTEFELFYAVFH